MLTLLFCRDPLRIAIYSITSFEEFSATVWKYVLVDLLCFLADDLLLEDDVLVTATLLQLVPSATLPALESSTFGLDSLGTRPFWCHLKKILFSFWSNLLISISFQFISNILSRKCYSPQHAEHWFRRSYYRSVGGLSCSGAWIPSLPSTSFSVPYVCFFRVRF